MSRRNVTAGGDGLGLFAKRLERGRFVWPKAEDGRVALTRAQLSMLLEGIDWRSPVRTATPEIAVLENKNHNHCFRLCHSGAMPIWHSRATVAAPPHAA